jgi:acyl carrier protein
LKHSEINREATSEDHSMPIAKRWERSDIERDIRDIIFQLLNLNDVTQEDIRLSQPNFFTNLGATSIDTMELFLAVEKKFGFQFGETELNASLLVTLDGFVDFVYTKLYGNS